MIRWRNCISILLIVVVMSVMVSGCGGGISKKEIIGKWKITKLTESNDSSNNMLNEAATMLMSMLFSEGSTIEFINENKVSIGYITVDYKLLNGNKLQLGSDNSEGGATIFDIEIDGNRMILKNLVIIELEKFGK